MSNSEELKLAKEVARKARELAKEKEAKLLSSIRAEFYVQLSEVLKSGAVKAATWHVGDGRPAIEFGNANDFYLNTSNGDVFFNNAGTWGVVLNVKGKDGIDGKDGDRGETGRVGLAGTNGKNGKDGRDGVDGKDGKDGKDGAKGKDGVDGKDGRNGSKWYTGRVSPPYDTGEVGDFYLQENGTFYEKTKPIEWTRRGSLRGPAGANGVGGGTGGGGGIVESLQGGVGIAIDATDPTSPVIDFEPESFNSDDWVEGSTNLYSQWELTTAGIYDYLRPQNVEHGLVIGDNIDTSVSSAFQGASAYFNGSIDGTNTGINYFVNMAYGAGFIPLGGVFAGGHARGTADAPSQTLALDWLGGMFFTGADDVGGWANGNSEHLLPGYFVSSVNDVTAGNLDQKLSMGGLLTPMFSINLDTNAITFNETGLDSDLIINGDLGIIATFDGGTRQILLTDGAEGNPTLGFTSELDLGFFYDAGFKFGGSAGTLFEANSFAMNFSEGATITIGDTNIFRNEADVLATDDSFEFTDPTKGVILASPDTTRWLVTIDDSGSLISTVI